MLGLRRDLARNLLKLASCVVCKRASGHPDLPQRVKKVSSTRNGFEIFYQNVWALGLSGDFKRGITRDDPYWAFGSK